MPTFVRLADGGQFVCAAHGYVTAPGTSEARWHRQEINVVCPRCLRYEVLCDQWWEWNDRSLRCMNERGHSRMCLIDAPGGQRYSIAKVDEGEDEDEPDNAVTSTK